MANQNTKGTASIKRSQNRDKDFETEKVLGKGRLKRVQSSQCRKRGTIRKSLASQGGGRRVQKSRAENCSSGLKSLHYALLAPGKKGGRPWARVGGREISKFPLYSELWKEESKVIVHVTGRAGSIHARE